MSAVNLFDQKLAMAKELGAAYTVNARQEDPAAAIKALGGADAAISLAVSQGVRAGIRPRSAASLPLILFGESAAMRS